MAASLLISKNPCHVRSTSLPARSHPVALRIADQLQKLRAFKAPASSSSSSSALSDALGGLADLYDCVEDLLQSPLTQQALASNALCVDEMLDGSLRMLDLCETATDALKLMKGSAEDLLSALRRRDSSSLRSQVGGWISSRKKMQKNMNRCLKALKKTDKDDEHHVGVVGVLREVRRVTISALEALSSFISLSRPATAARQSLVSKWMLGSAGKVACVEEIENMHEVEKVDSCLCSFHNRKSLKFDADGCEWMQNMQKSLMGLDESLRSLEDGLDHVFRRLIKARVSLLNILNH
ncbi:hypothetical protein ACLOJK_002333 [Asimina triloba]